MMNKSLLFTSLIAVTLTASYVSYQKLHHLTPNSSQELIPLEVLFANQNRRLTPNISPDGTQLSYLAPFNGIMNIWVKTVGIDDDHVVTQDTNRGIQTYFWTFDNQHLLYLQDKDGDENWRLYKVTIATKEVTTLTPFDNVQVRINTYRKQYPNRFLFSMNQRNPQEHDLYELDLTTNSINMIAENPGGVANWIVDWNLEVRGALKAGADGGYQLLVRTNKETPWQVIEEWNSDEGTAPALVHFFSNNNLIYLVDSKNENTATLSLFDITTGTRKIIAQDPHYDLHSGNFDTLFDQDTGVLQALHYDQERLKWIVFDKNLIDDFAAMQALDQGDMVTLGRSNNNDIWIIAFNKDNGPRSYWLYNKNTHTGTFLFDHQSLLKKYTLASMKPVTFQARDGLTLHGYLSCPPQGECKNIPLVLVVHGGPWVRDVWGFHPEVQLLATRGYAVLQVNYRGSKGYGKEFMQASFGEWGGKMHDDLIDGVTWAIDQGIANPKKIAIWGGSYGGYSALVGATFTPDVFCCAVDIVGMSNLLTLFNSFPPYWEMFKTLWLKRVIPANTPDWEQYLKDRSPLFKVDAIKIPVLIAQGANDPRVKQAEAEQIVAALKAKELPYEYMLFEDEGHGFVKPENKIKFYKKAEEFLAHYLR